MALCMQAACIARYDVVCTVMEHSLSIVLSQLLLYMQILVRSSVYLFCLKWIKKGQNNVKNRKKRVLSTPQKISLILQPRQHDSRYEIAFFIVKNVLVTQFKNETVSILCLFILRILQCLH